VKIEGYDVIVKRGLDECKLQVVVIEVTSQYRTLSQKILADDYKCDLKGNIRNEEECKRFILDFINDLISLHKRYEHDVTITNGDKFTERKI